MHLLARGEDPRNIRVVDMRRPVREDLLFGKAAEVGFVVANVCDLASLRAAFSAHWPDSNSKTKITVFHTVSTMRYYERHPFFIPRSTDINVTGTRNVLTVVKESEVDIFIYTSSASIPVPRTNFWVWPWQTHPTTSVQVVKDEFHLARAKRKHSEFFSNYSYTKYIAERQVCEADSPSDGFRTGCLRPGNAIYGSGGDLNAGAYLVRGNNPS